MNLTDNDVQTILNALRCAEEDARKLSQTFDESNLARRALVNSADAYRQLRERLEEADSFRYEG